MEILQCGTRRFEQVRAVVFDKDGTLALSQQFLEVLAHSRAGAIAQLWSQGDGERGEEICRRLLEIYGMVGSQGQIWPHLHPARVMAVGSRRENLLATAAVLTAQGPHGQGLDWVAAVHLAQQGFALADQRCPYHPRQTPLAPHVQDLLDHLVALPAALPLVLLTSDSPENAHHFVAHYGLGRYFKHIQGADPQWAKPDPALLLRLADRLGLEPQNLVMIGDSAADLTMAAAAAVPSIGVVWGWQGHGEYLQRHLKAEAIAAHPKEIQLL
jgi:phosphoglycolate phosphatase